MQQPQKEQLTWDERAAKATENAGDEGVDLEAELADVRRPASDRARGAFGLPGGFEEIDGPEGDPWKGKATKGAIAHSRPIVRSTKTGGKVI